MMKLKVSNKISETGLKHIAGPEEPLLGSIVDGYAIAYVDWLEDKVLWTEIFWDGAGI